MFPKLKHEEIWHLRDTGRCPDCKEGVLMEGPEAGCMVNVECADCGAEFNLCRDALDLSHRLPNNES